MSLTVTPEPSGFGAAVTGLDLSEPLPAPVLDAVKQVWAQHAVVWFPDQPLTHDQLEAFTLQLGPFGHDPYIAPLDDHPHVLEVRREPDEQTSPFGSAWHSDWSFQETPPAATLLHAKVIPPVGGDTLYADGRAAYDALSPVMQAVLAPLRVVHSAKRPYGPDGLYASEPAGRSMRIITSVEAEKTFTHPLVRTHPVTGRRALFINPVYSLGIEGMTEPESEALLGFLYAHMTQEAFVHRHRWSEGMLTVWDNRCTMHNATGGYDGHRRLLHRTTVAGERPV
jgi:taurine dioxygenase